MRERAIVAAVLAALLPACATTPKGPAAGPGADFLRPYVGQQRILRFQGDRQRVAVRKSDPAQLPGTCDVAVEVKSAVLAKGAPQLTLETIGTPTTERGRPRCKAIPGVITLSLSGYERDAAGTVVGRLDQVLPTPEQYLRAYGVTFDLPAGSEPAVAASSVEHTGPTNDELRLQRRVTVWPKRLFWVEPTMRDPRVRHEGEIEFEAVVGADGRIYRPALKGGLDPHHIAAIRRVLPMWRFEPARAGQEALPAYHTVKTVFRIM
jgi:hypothetical protein